MTDKEVCEKIKELNKKYIIPETEDHYEGCEDEESYHREMENIILDLLKTLNYNEAVEMFEKARIHFWYA